MSDELEARVRRLEDLLAIQQLFIDYGEHLDSGDFDAYSTLFADDGEVLLGPLGRARGPQAIKDLMVSTFGDGVGKSYHIVSSPRVALDGDTAKSTVMWSVVGSDADGRATLTMLGHHIDDLVRVDGRWFFQRRRGVMNVPAVLPAAPS
jgi:ketosteroid isomerase-like protein